MPNSTVRILFNCKCERERERERGREKEREKMWGRTERE